MAVDVDDCKGPYGRMGMSHMIAERKVRELGDVLRVRETRTPPACKFKEVDRFNSA